MLRALRIVLPAIVLAVLAVEPAGSSTVVKMTNKDLAERADQIVHGKCVSKQSRVSDDGNFIYTEFTLAITERVKGDADGATSFTFRQLGGVVGDRGLAIAGSATFREGEEVVAFLDKPHPKTGCRHTIGLAQGKFSVVLDEVEQTKFVERDMDGLKLVDPRTGQVDPNVAPAPRVRFDPFMVEIRGYVKK